MDKSTIVSEVNDKMNLRIGYKPYIFKANRILCTNCRTEYKEVSVESLIKTKKIKNSKGNPVEVHECTGCRYLKGTNVSLKKRISDIRKELKLLEFPNDNKLRNEYLTPQSVYNFIDTILGANIAVTEDELLEKYNTLKLNEAQIKKDEIKPEVSDNKDSTPDTDTDDDDSFFKDDESADISTESEIVDNAVINDADSSVVVDDGDDLSDLFNSDESLLTDGEVVEDSNTGDSNLVDNDPLDILPHNDDISDLNNNDETTDEDATLPVDEFSDDIIDDFFNDSSEEITEKVKPVNENYVHRSGVTDLKTEKDDNVERLVKENMEYEEANVFRIDDRKEHVFDIVRNSRITDLTESFIDSNAKVTIDRILTLFEKRGNRKLKYKIYISEATHECPVVDFEGNIRLIFVDLGIPGGQYNVQAEINSKVRPTFGNTCEYEMMTYIIFSDMIEHGLLNRVVRAVSKNIAFNLKIKGIFNAISVISDSDQFFYTTSDYDKDTIARFDMENTAGNLDKPCNGEVAIVSRWDNPNIDNSWKYRKELSNRATLARGGDIDYDDLSMFMTCSLKFIVLPQKPDGTINVTVVDYIESLDLYIRDGFGVLIGVMLHNIKINNPNSKIDVYYELDSSMIPSPTISRYIKNNLVRPVNVNPEISSFNSIIEKISAQNGVQPNKIPVEGEPFDSPEYNSNHWKTYVLSPENRKYVSDGKRTDWRRFGRKSFAKTLGDRFAEFKNTNLNDRTSRKLVLEKLGYQTVVQPQIVKSVVEKHFCRNALMKVMQTCSGVFSISQYIRANRSTVVDDNYMSANGATSQFTPQQMQQYQQMMMMNQYQNGGYPGFQQQYPGFGGMYQQ